MATQWMAAPRRTRDGRARVRHTATTNEDATDGGRSKQRPRARRWESGGESTPASCSTRKSTSDATQRAAGTRRARARHRMTTSASRWRWGGEHARIAVDACEHDCGDLTDGLHATGARAPFKRLQALRGGRCVHEKRGVPRGHQRGLTHRRTTTTFTSGGQGPQSWSRSTRIRSRNDPAHCRLPKIGRRLTGSTHGRTRPGALGGARESTCTALICSKRSHI